MRNPFVISIPDPTGEIYKWLKANGAKIKYKRGHTYRVNVYNQVKDSFYPTSYQRVAPWVYQRVGFGS